MIPALRERWPTVREWELPEEERAPLPQYEEMMAETMNQIMQGMGIPPALTINEARAIRARR